MKKYQLTKQAAKKLKKLIKSDTVMAQRLKDKITLLIKDELVGESLQGYREFKKIRVGNFRIIYTLKEELLSIIIIDKRETVYQKFKHLLKNAHLF